MIEMPAPVHAKTLYRVCMLASWCCSLMAAQEVNVHTRYIILHGQDAGISIRQQPALVQGSCCTHSQRIAQVCYCSCHVSAFSHSAASSHSQAV